MLIYVKPPVGDFFTFRFMKIIEHDQTIFSKFVAPWQESFADAGDGDGGEPFWDHFRTVLEHTW